MNTYLISCILVFIIGYILETVFLVVAFKTKDNIKTSKCFYKLSSGSKFASEFSLFCFVLSLMVMIVYFLI